MKGLFVHDHRFPKHNDGYLYSYGFDDEFFKRYLGIFKEMDIIGRSKETKYTNIHENEKINNNVSIYTIKEHSELLKKDIRKEINYKIKNSDYIVARVPSILGMYAAYKAKKFNKPCLIEVVGCYWDGIVNVKKSKVLEASLLTYLMKKTIYSSKNVIYVTEEFLQNRYPTKGSNIACSNVTLHSVNQQDLNNRIDKIKEKREKLVVGTCATLDVLYKGQQDVIKALAKLKQLGYEVNYQLVGGGDSSYLMNLAKEYGVEDQIEILGSLKHENVFKWLENIDIYIHPSKQEGLSRAIIEAMSKGCPVIAANAGGVKELIDKNYIFQKGNVNEICKLLISFDEKKMIEQSINNHKNSKKYLKEILYERRNNFYEKFINEN